MHTDQTAAVPEPVKALYFEVVVRNFVSQFGDDTLDMIDMTIERLEAQGPTFALEVWRDIRLAFLRKAPVQTGRMLQ